MTCAESVGRDIRYDAVEYREYIRSVVRVNTANFLLV